MPARRAHRDDPWRRLPWLVPVAALTSLAAVAGFLSLLVGAPAAPVQNSPLEVQVVELPAAPAASPEPPQSEPPHTAEPELPTPSPDPPPPQVEPDPAPMLQAEPKPPPPPPPPKLRPPQPARQARPVQSPSASSSPAEMAAPPGADTAGARAVYQPLPEIPEALRRHAVELVALARFRVAANGSAEVELVIPTPDPAFNRVLLEALRKWRFFPKLEAGKPVATVIDIRIPISIR